MKRKINILLILGFSIALFMISFIISSNYINIKYVIDENKFNESFKYVDIELEKPLTILEADKILKDCGISKYTTQPRLIINKIGGIDYANKLIGVSEGFNIEDYFKIEWFGNGKTELANREDVVVVGESLVKALNKINNSEYIEIQGKKHKIVGVLKDSQYASFMTFIPIDHLENKNKESNKIQCLVDGKMPISFGKLNGSSNSVPTKSVIKFVIEKSMTIEGEILDLLLCIVTIIIFSVCYAQINKRNFSIMRLIGANPKHILYEYIKGLIWIYLVAFFIAIVISSISVNYISSHIDDIFFNLDLINILITCITGIILTLMTSVICMFKTLKFKILEDIR